MEVWEKWILESSTLKTVFQKILEIFYAEIQLCHFNSVDTSVWIQFLLKCWLRGNYLEIVFLYMKNSHMTNRGLKMYILFIELIALEKYQMIGTKDISK